MAETLSQAGELRGHSGWVTSIAAPLDPNSDVLLSSSRYVPPQHHLSSSPTFNHPKPPKQS